MSLRSNILKELQNGPMTEKQLRARFGAEAKKLSGALKSLKGAGKVQAENGLYRLARPAAGGDSAIEATVEGTLVKLGRSFGFVAPTDGSADIFIPGHSLNGALPRDTVLVGLSRYPRVPGSREGEVLAVQQAHNRVVGTVEADEGRLVLVPDNAPDTRLPIQKSADGGAKPGEKAAGEIIQRGARHEDIRVGIVQRFGMADSARQNAKAVLFAAGVEKAFPEAVKAQAKAVGAQKITKEALKGRLDLRGAAIFTIDSASTKDIDDAISAERTADGYRLGVHIADVSHYVQPKTALDEEALARGTSIYYADSVIPMLPKALSNGICSLNPGEDRLAFSCLMELDRDARLLDYSFKKSVISSRVKGVYSEINALFEGGDEAEIEAKYAGVRDELSVMREIYHKLAALRQKRGAMEIESDEPYLEIDAEGRCVGVEKRERGESERLIEEFMLMANTSAAHLARRRQLPFVYRVHEAPGAEKVEQLTGTLKALGVEAQFKGAVPTQPELAALLDKARGTPLEIPVHTAVLRAMTKANYQPVPIGHFGLALADYAHFTSPIRRYPDLAIHRILSDVVAGMAGDALHKRYDKFAGTASALSSERELVATQVERDCDSLYKAEYMKQFVGDCFDGVVVSVMSFGIYVALPNTVEGLVHVSHLSAGHMELSEGVALRDPVTGKTYRVGDAVRVCLAGVDVSRGHVDFVPAKDGA